jgi:hypothetical protein
MTDIKTHIAEARRWFDRSKLQALADVGYSASADRINALATDCETLVREREELQALLMSARLEGESDADTLRHVMASHAALVQAGEELPVADLQAVLASGLRLDSEVAALAANSIMFLFHPLFARLTQERDEARAERNGAHDILDRLAARFEVSRAELPQAAEYAHAYTQEVEPDRDALHQRAKRAEAERDEERRRANAYRSEAEHNAAANHVLRARTAELEALLSEARHSLEDVLESRPEPSADVVERLILVMRKSGAPYESHALYNMARAALAEMGEEAWPSERDLVLATSGSGPRTRDALETLFHSRLSPIIGALRAKVAELEAALACIAHTAAVAGVTLPQDAPAASAPPEGQAEAGEGGKVASRGRAEAPTVHPRSAMLRAAAEEGARARAGSDDWRADPCLQGPPVRVESEARSCVGKPYVDARWDDTVRAFVAGATWQAGQSSSSPPTSRTDMDGRAVVDLSSWPTLREVEARAASVFVGDDPDGVAEAFRPKGGES